MWSWIIKVAVVSFLFIFLLHYLYSFFKTTLTSPKIKDLVNKPMRKYDSIYDSLENNQSYIEESESAHIRNTLLPNSTTTQNPLKQNMKDELKKYLSELSGSGGNKASDSNMNMNMNTNTNTNINTKSSVNPMANANPATNPMASPSIPDFAMSNLSSSSSFSSSYSDF
jgi:hypothetical protein